ncbi:hypothetical protein DER45DRAFT_551808 [Fusarium avenaceum]|nr:hypothetical protein DER45DRAFT_551808 [Fusarium avenaceum]
MTNQCHGFLEGINARGEHSAGLSIASIASIYTHVMPRTLPQMFYSGQNGTQSSSWD